jgi:protein-S-isoprenylcysteine O-methyltransferase Ste14
MLHIRTHRVNMRAFPVLGQSQPSAHNQMLKLPPPIWALIYVLTAAVISWFFGWSKVPGLPLAPLGISLVTISWVLPVWAIVLFRREGTEVEPTSPTNRTLITSGPYQFTRNPMYLGLVILTLGIAWCAHSPVRYCQLGPHSL